MPDHKLISKRVTTLGEFIIQNQAKFAFATGELSSLLSSIRLAAKLVHNQINKAGLVDDLLGSTGDINAQGEVQQVLDAYANNLFLGSLRARGQVCGIASEENETIVPIQEASFSGKYVVLIDPLDGSSNIDVNVSVGTIFSIYRRVSDSGSKVQLEDFLQEGHKQVAAGYIIYGSSTMLVYTTGHSVNGFTFDPTVGVFFLSHPKLEFPKDGLIYSVNEANYHHFPKGVQDYLDQCKTSEPGYSSRYIGSLVADFHRNLICGGIYLYPASRLHPHGKLRLLYECNPLAFIAEQANGLALAGRQRVLDIVPTELHQRVPFYIGSEKMIEELKGFDPI